MLFLVLLYGCYYDNCASVPGYLCETFLLVKPDMHSFKTAYQTRLIKQKNTSTEIGGFTCIYALVHFEVNKSYENKTAFTAFIVKREEKTRHIIWEQDNNILSSVSDLSNYRDCQHNSKLLEFEVLGLL